MQIPTAAQLMAFHQNPLIQKLGLAPFWTISDDNKRPLDAHYLLKYHHFKLFNDDTKHLTHSRQLVPLAQLDADPTLQYTNRALFLQAAKTHILMIDVEPVATPAIVKSLCSLPVSYSERSKHNGWHLLLEVPEDLIKPNMQYLFGVDVIKGPKKQFELLSNAHFVTFTRRVQPTRPVDVMHNQQDRNQISRFLEQLLAYDRQQAIERHRIVESKQFDRKYALDQLPDFIHKLADLLPAEDWQAFKAITRKDYDNDDSRYELAVMGKIRYTFYFEIARGYQTPFAGALIGKPLDEITDDDLTYATYLVATKVLEPRPANADHPDKWQELRDGMPWLLYRAAQTGGERLRKLAARKAHKLAY